MPPHKQNRTFPYSNFRGLAMPGNRQGTYSSMCINTCLNLFRIVSIRIIQMVQSALPYLPCTGLSLYSQHVAPGLHCILMQESLSNAGPSCCMHTLHHSRQSLVSLLRSCFVERRSFGCEVNTPLYGPSPWLSCNHNGISTIEDTHDAASRYQRASRSIAFRS